MIELKTQCKFNCFMEFVFMINVAISINANDLKDILNAVLNGKDKNKVAKEAAAIIRPAKKDPKAFIRFNEDESTKIESKSIQAMPSAIADEEPEEYIDDINDIELEIRATDIDSSKRGWAVVVPKFDENRSVKLHIDPTIKLNKLRGKSKIRGNVTNYLWLQRRK